MKYFDIFLIFVENTDRGIFLPRILIQKIPAIFGAGRFISQPFFFLNVLLHLNIMETSPCGT